jgi:hypothetical protein
LAEVIIQEFDIGFHLWPQDLCAIGAHAEWKINVLKASGVVSEDDGWKRNLTQTGRIIDVPSE